MSVVSASDGACAHRSLPDSCTTTSESHLCACFSFSSLCFIVFSVSVSTRLCLRPLPVSLHARSRVRDAVCLAAERRGGSSVHRGGDGCYQVTLDHWLKYILKKIYIYRIALDTVTSESPRQLPVVRTSTPTFGWKRGANGESQSNCHLQDDTWSRLNRSWNYFI